MKTSLRLFCGVLLIAFNFSGCAEQILDSASNEPAPSVTSGEESAANTIAKFSTSEGLAPQPSDVVLANVNAALPAESQLQGVSRLMPVHIPFSALLTNLYHDNGCWDLLAGQKLAENLLIFPTLNPTASVYPLPTIGGGTFKVVYQDANHDLVLVPGSSTFQAGTQYAAIVKTSLGDGQGNPLSPDMLINILTSPDPIVVDGKIVNTLIRDLVGGESDGGIASATVYDGLRAGYSQLVQGLQAMGQITSHNDLAQLFTFTTEAEDPAEAEATIQLLSTEEAKLTDTASAFQDEITWATNYLANSNAIGVRPVNLKSEVVANLNLTIPRDNVSTIYKGCFNCLNFLSESKDG